MTSDNRPICEVLGEGHLGELADSQHLRYGQFQRLKPQKDIFEKSKHTADSKQTADHLKKF